MKTDDKEMNDVSMQSAPKNENAPQTNGDHKSTASSAMVLGSDAYRGALEPQSTEAAWHVAEMMASIGYCGVTSAPEALGRIMTGRGLGLSAMQSMRGIYTVNGRPGIDAALMQALCLQNVQVCEHFDFVSAESDETKATYVAKRVGRPEVKHTYTIEDAEKMGVLDRGDTDQKKKDNNWTKVRKAMLRARAKSELARIVFPDLIFGMYSREEIEAGLGVDPNEMVGDIVAREEAEAEQSQVPRPTTVQSAKRDYAAEANALKERIAAATTRQARAEVRQAFEAWDGIEPFRSQVQEAYNATRKAAAAPAADAPAQPALMPEGNLFGEQAKDGAK